MSRRSSIALCAGLLLVTPALTTAVWAAGSYEAELDPTPFDATNRADVIESIGNLTATLDGTTLTVKGTFSNFTSPATGGSFRIGLAKGVPGDAIGTLTVEHKDGKAYTGRILNQLEDSIVMLVDPEDSTKLVTIKNNNIEDKQLSSVSLMPKDLLKQLNQNEVLDLMAYLLSRGNAKDPMFRR